MTEFTHTVTPDGAEVHQGAKLVASYAGDAFAEVCAQALARSLNAGLGELEGELPETCYASNLSDDSLVLLKRGERGFWPTEDYPLGQFPDFSTYADYLNARRGVTPAQRNAMEAGSVFGFDVPGANPAKYGPDGRLQR